MLCLSMNRRTLHSLRYGPYGSQITRFSGCVRSATGTPSPPMSAYHDLRLVLSIGVDVVHFPVILADYGIQVVQDVSILGLWKLEVFCLCHAAPPYYGRSRMLTAIYAVSILERP